MTLMEALAVMSVTLAVVGPPIYFYGKTIGGIEAGRQRDADVDRLLGIGDPDPVEGLVDYRPTFRSGQVARWERWLARWGR